jgi:hypothetical protein
MRKSSIPLFGVQWAPGVSHMEVQSLFVHMLWYYPHYMSKTLWRFFLRSVGALHLYEVPRGLVLPIRCALLQFNFLSIFTSFEKLLKIVMFWMEAWKVLNHSASKSWIIFYIPKGLLTHIFSDTVSLRIQKTSTKIVNCQRHFFCSTILLLASLYHVCDNNYPIFHLLNLLLICI